MGSIPHSHRDCSGDGTCAAARLHFADARCAYCGGMTFDHASGEPEKPFCEDCGKAVPIDKGDKTC